MKSSQLKIVCDQVQYDFNFQHSLVTNDPEMMVSVLSDYGISTSVQIARELIVNLKSSQPSEPLESPPECINL